MVDIDLHALLAPVSEGAPSGPNLEYDPAYTALEEAARGRAEQQFGETVIAAQEPDWRAMQEQASALLARTRDLRLAIYWLRAATRLRGFVAFAEGIALIHGLLDRQWDTVHPQLDASDHDDPTMRLNALAPLADADEVLADLRGAPLGSTRGGITARQIELAFGRAEPNSGEAVASEAGALQGLKAAHQGTPGLLELLVATHDRVVEIDQRLTDKVGLAQAPDLKALRALTQCLALAAKAAHGDSPIEAAGAQGSPGSPSGGAGALPGAISTRADALRALDQACEWIERHEPTNPAPLLIRRAKRLMGKSFIDIIRDLAPEGLSQVERIAGVESVGE